VPLEEGECYLYQIIHMRVVTVDGEELGEVAEIIETGANLVYVVRGKQGEILLPDTEEVVVSVDVQAGQITVRLIDGLI
jgi:16S rRNA processing protein RimM